MNMLKVFTFRSKEEIEELQVQVIEKPHAREAQKVLAADVTRMVHGEEALEQVLSATGALWGRGDLWALDPKTLQAAVAHLPQGTFVPGETTAVDAVLAVGFESGRQAALRLVRQGGLSVNNQKVSDPDQILGAEEILPGDRVLLRKGRRALAALVPEQAVSAVLEDA